MFCFSLYTGFQFFRILDHTDDFFISCRSGHCLHPDLQFSFFQYSSGINTLPRNSSHRHCLSCQRSLVDHAFPIGNLTVKRDHVSHMDYDLISRLYFRRLHQNFLIFPFQPDFLDIQRHTSRKITY